MYKLGYILYIIYYILYIIVHGKLGCYDYDR